MFQLIPKHAYEYMLRQGRPKAGWLVMRGPKIFNHPWVEYRYLYIGRVITPIRRTVDD